MARHLLTLMDLGSDGLIDVLDRADELKRIRGRSDHPKPLANKSVAIIMEKASARTRISFEVGVRELGGQAIVLSGNELQLGKREPLNDAARVLSRYVHAVVYRTYGHDRIENLAASSTVPVINALTDKFHPCQVLADLMTIREHRKKGLNELVVSWIGDGNNMAHCWILASALANFELRLACPPNYQPSPDVVEIARSLGRGKLLLTSDPGVAAQGAHVVTTDVWASMGQEDEAEARRQAFAGFGVTEKLMKRAEDGAIFLHCLPAHRGEEVEAAVIDGPASRVWDEAENRLHVQKALLDRLI
jgi:ornithine carbamoyltransferase